MHKPSILLTIPSISIAEASFFPHDFQNIIWARMERMGGCNGNLSVENTVNMKEYLLLHAPMNERFKTWIRRWLSDSCHAWDSISVHPSHLINNSLPLDHSLAIYHCLIQELLEQGESKQLELFRQTIDPSVALFIHTYCYTYMEDALEHQLKKIGVDYQSIVENRNVEMIAQLNTKLGAHRLFLQLDIPCMYLSDTIFFTTNDLINESKRLFMQGMNSIRWKPNNGFGGTGQIVVSSEQINDQHTSSFQDKYVAKGYVCQENLSSIRGSPSVQGWIDGVDLFTIHSIQQQYIRDYNVHIGSDLRVPKKYIKRLTQLSQDILQRISHLGIQGPVSIDYIISKSNEIYPVDLNLRHGSGTLISSVMRRLIGPYNLNTRRFHDIKHPENSRCFIYYDSYNWSDFFPGMLQEPYHWPTPDELLFFLETYCQPLIYDPTKKIGFIFMHLGALETTGNFGIAFIGEDYDSIVLMENQLKHQIQTCWSTRN